jgi:biopolymer transport protein ExbD
MKSAHSEFEIRSTAQAARVRDNASFPLPPLRFQRGAQAIVRPDLMPVIGVGCQVIFFFLLALSFAAAEQDASIDRPESASANLPESRSTLRITSGGQVILGGDAVDVASLSTALARRKPAIRGDSREQATLIVCADRDAAAGVVRRVIKICEDAGFESFRLRDAVNHQ